MKYKQNQPELSCFVCMRPEYYCDHVECYEAPEHLTDGSYDELELPHKCGMFLPAKRDQCSYCETKMDIVLFKHKYWFEAGECTHPLCEDCYTHVTEETLSEYIHCMC